MVNTYTKFNTLYGRVDGILSSGLTIAQAVEQYARVTANKKIRELLSGSYEIAMTDKHGVADMNECVCDRMYDALNEYRNEVTIYLDVSSQYDIVCDVATLYYKHLLGHIEIAIGLIVMTYKIERIN